MLYSQNLETCLGPGRLARVALQPYLERALLAAKNLPQRHEADFAPILTLPQRVDDLPKLKAIAARLAEREEVLVLGTGGSSLGGQTLAALADPKRPGPRVTFLESVDPLSFDQLVARLTPARTGLLIISKSGSTGETVAQTLALLPLFLAAYQGAQRRDFIQVITERQDSPLAQLATHHGLGWLAHEADLGGRFSVFSVTALLPALLLGLDVAALRAGAVSLLASLGRDDCAAALGAAVSVGLLERLGCAQQVFFPYSDRLRPFTQWFRQLWAESLGKGGKGQTPVPALGPVDQHSQLQLYLDGPSDKAFTFFRLATKGQGALLDPAALGLVGSQEMAGRRLGDLLEASARATAETLAAAGKPVREFLLPQLDEATLGALLMHFILETLIAGVLLGVDPFGQPAVEQSKALARRYLLEQTA